MKLGSIEPKLENLQRLMHFVVKDGIINKSPAGEKGRGKTTSQKTEDGESNFILCILH